MVLGVTRAPKPVLSRGFASADYADQSQDPAGLYSCAPRMTSYKRPPPPILVGQTDRPAPGRPSEPVA